MRRRHAVVVLLESIALAVALSLAARPAAATPEIAIVGAAADGFKFHISGETFTHRFKVLAKNYEAVGPATAFIRSLENAAGSPVETSASWPSDANLSLTSATDLAISATLPELGDYTTELVISVANTRTTTRVAVTRALAKAGLEALGSTTTMLTTSCCNSSADVPLLLRDTGDRSRKLEIPSSLAFDRQLPGNILLRSGVKLSRVEQAGAVASRSIELPRGGTAQVTLRFEDIVENGRYQGNVRIVSANREPFDVAIALLVKRPWWLAFLFISLGVVTSTVLRWYLTKGRNAIAWQRDLAALRERMVELASKPRGPREQAVLASCKKTLSALAARADEARAVLASVTDLSASIQSLSGKLDAFEQLVQGYERMAQLPSAAQRSLLDALDEAAGQLRSTDTASEIATIFSKLNALKFSQAQRDALNDAIARAEALLRASIELAAIAGTPEVNKFWSDLVQIKTSANDDSRLDDAQKQLTLFEGQLVLLLARALAREIESAPPPPLTDSLWEVLQNRIAPELRAVEQQAHAAPELAADAFSKLLTRYADELVTALKDVGAVIDKRIDDSAHISDPDRPAAHNRVKTALAGLETALGASISARLDAIRNGQQELMNLWKQSAPATLTATSAGGAGITFVRAWFFPQLGRGTSIAARESDVSHLRWTLRTSDNVVTLALFLAAVLSGINALWVNDPTWGGAGAYMIAMLWGLGLHSVGNLTFDGLLALRDRFSKAG